MSEQQYRVIADRDKGDDPQWDDVAYGDRYHAEMTDAGDFDRILRIERPVPNTNKHAPDRWSRPYGDPAECSCKRPSLPTREQIAEAVRSSWRWHGNDPQRIADVVLALLNGYDRD